LLYKCSDEYRSQAIAWDIVSYKQQYPDSKLSAIKSSAYKDGNSSEMPSLEQYVNNNLEARNNLANLIQSYFPQDEMNRIHDELSKDDYEIGNNLDKVFLVSFREAALAAGFAENVEYVSR
jgi:hypothetical protein